MSLLLLSPARWQRSKLVHLRRLVVLAHQRHLSPSGLAQTKCLSDEQPKDYAVYKSVLVLFGLVDALFGTLFKVP